MFSKSLSIGLLVFILFFSVNTANSQSNKFIEIEINSSVSCDSNTFYAISNTGLIREFYFINNVVVFNSIVSSLSGGSSLGYCNGFSINGNNPSFFSNFGQQLSADNASYLDSAWLALTPSDSFLLANCGGSGKYLYYNGKGPSDIFPKYILKADSGQNNLIYTSPQGYSISVADLVADSLGNVWFFLAPDTNIFSSQFMCCISPTGVLLNQIPVSIYSQGAYGLFLKSNKFYLGINNAVYPDKLLPLSLSGSTILFEPPISTNLSITFGTVDLASCYSYIITGFKEIKKPNKANITLYPNPATNKITMGNIPPHAQELCVTNSMGAVVWRQRVNGQAEVEVSTLHLAPGIYAVSVITKVDVLVKKMVKQ